MKVYNEPPPSLFFFSFFSPLIGNGRSPGEVVGVVVADLAPRNLPDCLIVIVQSSQGEIRIQTDYGAAV